MSMSDLSAKERILAILGKAELPLRVVDIDKKAQINLRTYTSRLVSELLSEGKIVQQREGRELFYALNHSLVFIDKDITLTNLHEEEIWQEIVETEDFKKDLSDSIENLFSFAFQEMLNNAIDHSKSGIGCVKCWRDGDNLKFIIRDRGIGVFRNIMTKKHLKTELEAIQELIKGKVTTAPKHHSGEGIFWTSKAADYFSITSYQMKMSIDNNLNDWSVERLDETLLGSEIYFEVSLKSKHSLSKLFEKYSLSKENYSFETTSIPVCLFEGGDVWMSRSQARRILSGLEKYQKIILDFKGIDVIGQGFADEIFRVFNIAHPDIILEPINMSSSVELLIRRAQLDSTGRD